MLSFVTGMDATSNTVLDQDALNAIRVFLGDRGLDLPLVPENIQEEWSLPFMRWVVERTTSGMECHLQPEDNPGIIIGTHRDIVCDPALYNLARVEAGWPTTHIVLGSNLARLDWVRKIMEANKALFIDRSLSGKAALQQQIRLSKDVARIVRQGGHVWIAQAPGRAKKGWDETHGGLLRMLALDWGGEELGPAALDGVLRPLVIRYERNPCDGLLVKEKLRGGKSMRDDERSMLAGLEGWKGRVRLAEGVPLDLSGWSQESTWTELAMEVNQKMDAMLPRGNWAKAAIAALGDQRYEALPAAFRERATELMQAEPESIGEASEETVLQHLCEVYREGSPTASVIQR